MIRGFKKVAFPVGPRVFLLSWSLGVQGQRGALPKMKLATESAMTGNNTQVGVIGGPRMVVA